LEKQIKNYLKNIDLKRKGTKFDNKKKNYKGWNWKTISIKKIIRTIKNNNQRNEDHIWYKNKMSRDKIQRQINSIMDSRPKTPQLKE
jgi:hypothetical protein